MNQPGELRQQIEDMALQLVVGEPEDSANASAWMPVLEKISAAAAREHADSVVSAAAVLGDALRALAQSPSDDPFTVSSVMQEGVANLQKALEAPAQEIPSQDMSLALDPELMSDFIVESREHLVNIESQVLTLEREPFDSEALNAVFRGFHTIKGLAGFLELWEVQKLAHEVETVLDRARNSQWTINPAGIDVILASADYLRRWLVHMEAVLHHAASEAPARDEALLSRITRLSSEPGEPESAGLAALAAVVSTDVAVSTHKEEPAANPPALATLVAERTGEIADEPVANPAAAAAPAAGRRQETMAVKVDTAKLDYLVDMAGEMVIAESLVRHDQELAALKNPLLLRKIAHLTRITVELQKTAMAMRLVPIGPLFRRMARLVRDLSRQFGKQVEMETQGDEIELDRNIVEELADPLMHMVRNALDHGIETPAERQAAGKPGGGAAAPQGESPGGPGGHRNHRRRPRPESHKDHRKGRSKGLIASADGLSDNEIYNLIFQPGFSTAAQVTNVSGRGVGMDVVRRHIEKLRGRIEIRSTVGARRHLSVETAAHAGHHRGAGGGRRAGALHRAALCGTRDVPSHCRNHLDRAAARRDGAGARIAVAGGAALPDLPRAAEERRSAGRRAGGGRSRRTALLRPGG